MNKRQAILSAIAQRLSTITKANNYNTDLGSNVFYRLDTPAEYDKNTLIYSDTYHQFEDRNEIFEHRLQVELKAVLFLGSDTSLVIEDLLSAIAVDKTWGQIATKTSFSDCSIYSQTAGKSAIALTLPLEITYRTKENTV